MGINELGLKIVQALLPVVVAFITALVGYGIAFLKKKTDEIENDTIRKSLDGALSEAEVVAIDAVRATNQVFTEALKERSEDGKLTKEEAQEAMRLSKQYFSSHISESSIQILEAALGPINYWLETFLEAKLAQTKIEKQVVNQTNPTLETQLGE